jgi:hypothetical protein|tara:strand:- start:3778 stop:3975 length:198 start_codon:yes stop_codon:yes gene_type:complete
MNKGELMKAIYTADELKNIDPSLPHGWEADFGYSPSSYWFVMNYNENVFGRLEDMRTIIKQKEKE